MIDITVTVDDAHLPSIRSVAAALTDRGMHVDGVQPILGVITGSCSQERLPGLGTVPGVSAVERARTSSVPPLDGTEDQGSTATVRPEAPPPDASAEVPGEGLLLEREPDGRYRVVDPPPPRPDDAEGPS